MPQPGYVFRDGGTTPPPESNTEESKTTRDRSATTTATTTTTSTSQQPSRPSTSRASRAFSLLGHRPGASTSTNNSDKGHHGHLHLSLPLPRILHHDTHRSSVSSSVGTSRDYHHIGESPKARAFVINAESHEIDEEHADDFSPGKLGASIERLYYSVGVDLVRLSRNISRIRSWQDPVHTGAYAAVYTLAWVFNVIVPTLLLGLLILTAAPEARSMVFPPPEADSTAATGTGTSGGTEHTGSVEASKQKDLSTNTTAAAATPTANGSAKLSVDKTRRREVAEAPIRTHLLRPAMHTMNRISDTWERLSNLLSPRPPFSHNKRIELAAMLIPISLLSLAITLQQVVRAATLISGLTFFSQPVIQRATHLLDANHPGWRKYLDPRNTFLRGVPNKAELVIVLRASGATNGAPVSPRLRQSAETSRSRSVATPPSSPPPPPSASASESSLPSAAAPAAPAPAAKPQNNAAAPVPTLNPPSPPSPPVANTTAAETDYPPSSFPGSQPQENPRRRSRSRSLSRSKIGRKLTSVLRLGKGGSHEHDDDHEQHDDHHHHHLSHSHDHHQPPRRSHDSRASVTISAANAATAAAAVADSEGGGAGGREKSG